MKPTLPQLKNHRLRNQHPPLSQPITTGFTTKNHRFPESEPDVDVYVDVDVNVDVNVNVNVNVYVSGGDVFFSPPHNCLIPQ